MRQEPANTIIDKLGGLSAVASVCEVTTHTVMRWRYPKAKGGTNGIVPPKYTRTLLNFAKEEGIELQFSDFAPAE